MWCSKWVTGLVPYVSLLPLVTAVLVGTDHIQALYTAFGILAY
jgi:hypothetical protein